MQEIEQGSLSVSTNQDDAVQNNLCAMFQSNIERENSRVSSAHSKPSIPFYVPRERFQVASQKFDPSSTLE